MLEEPTLIVFPLLAVVGLVVTIIAAGFTVAAIVAVGGPEWLIVVPALVLLYLGTFVTVYFNVALVCSVLRSLEGEDVTVSMGIAMADKRMRAIAGWSVFAATVYLIIRILDALADRYLPGAGSLVTQVFDLVWGLVTFFVIPVIATESLGPVETLKRSAKVFKQRWAEQVTGDFAIGILTFLFLLPAIALAMMGADAYSIVPAVGITLIIAGILLGVAVLLISSAVTKVFAVALFKYATDGGAQGPYSEEDLRSAFVPKKRRRGIFGSGRI